MGCVIKAYTVQLQNLKIVQASAVKGTGCLVTETQMGLNLSSAIMEIDKWANGLKLRYRLLS